MHKYLIAIVLCLLVVGCQFDPYADTYITHQPTHVETVGEYVLTEIQMEYYSPGIASKVKNLSSPPRIVLKDDGHFEAFDFPCFSKEDPFSYHFDSFRQLSGKWEIQRAGSVDDGSGNIKPTYGLELTDLPIHLDGPTLSGSKHVDGLVFGYGDPDEGNAIIFTKK